MAGIIKVQPGFTTEESHTEAYELHGKKEYGGCARNTPVNGAMLNFQACIVGVNWGIVTFAISLTTI